MSAGFCKLMLKLGKWELVGLDIPIGKYCVFLEAPHTSIWDFLIGYWYYRVKGGKLHVMIKKEAFFFPFGLILKALGGFPIDRKNPSAAILSIVHQVEKNDDKPFHLAMCPEGTRSAVHHWKTGYHAIAKAANIPVFLGFVDWGHKRVGIYGEYVLQGSAREDTDRIQEIYESLNLIGKHPEGYVTR